MKYESIQKIRNFIVEELSKCSNDKLFKLPFGGELLYEILFNDTKISYELLPILDRIDFSNVDFTGKDVSGVNFSNYKNVKINPQTVLNKSLFNTVCSGVEFIGPFDGVNIEGANMSGSNYQDIMGYDKNTKQK